MIFSTLILIFGTLFALSAVALASSADMLQPASTITYNEDLIVNGVGRFDSIHIGQEGVGGVTYFNGTIINVGDYVPVTFGDDVRVDGEIWRGTSKGVGDGMPIKVSDTMVPTLDDINDLGWPEQRWQNIYFSQNLLGNNANFNGNLTLQPAGISPDTNILLSAHEPFSLGYIPGNQKVFRGLYHSSNSKQTELAFGDMRVKNFIEQGTDIEFTGITGYDRENDDLFLFGFNEDKANNKRNIALVAGDIEGNDDGDLYISSNHIKLDGLSEMRFRGVGNLSITGGECKADGKTVKGDTVVLGNAGSGDKLHMCSGSAWYEIGMTQVLP